MTNPRAMLTIQSAREEAGFHHDWYEFLSMHSAHAREQAKSRYGLTMTLHDWETLNEQLFREEIGTFLFQPNQTTSIYRDISFKGQRIAVFFSETAYCVTSVIPRGDGRLAGLRPDGTKPDRNFISEARKMRLNLAKGINA